MKILIIRPIVSDREDALEEAIFSPYAAAGTEIIAKRINYGPSSIESEYDLLLSGPEILRLAKEGEAHGFDGVIINCFVNPALEAVREAVRYPVVGAGEASVNLGLCLGGKIGIITIMPSVLPLVIKQNQDLINCGRVVSVRSIGVPVLDIQNDDQILKKLYEMATRSILEDGANTIVLGCTGFGGMAEKLSEMLHENSLPVPVVDPAGAPLKIVEAMVSCKLRHSKIAYMEPSEKIRTWPNATY